VSRRDKFPSRARTRHISAPNERRTEDTGTLGMIYFMIDDDHMPAMTVKDLSLIPPEHSSMHLYCNAHPQASHTSTITGVCLPGRRLWPQREPSRMTWCSLSLLVTPAHMRDNADRYAMEVEVRLGGGGGKDSGVMATGSTICTSLGSSCHDC
jgi:hypothetical protein